MAETKVSKTITVKDVKQEKADQSKANRANGGADVVVDVLSTVNVKFKKDFGKMKKDKTYRISQLAYEVYDKNGVVEKIN
jgi:hypothetical protein